MQLAVNLNNFTNLKSINETSSFGNIPVKQNKSRDTRGIVSRYSLLRLEGGEKYPHRRLISFPTNTSPRYPLGISIDIRDYRLPVSFTSSVSLGTDVYYRPADFSLRDTSFFRPGLTSTRLATGSYLGTTTLNS